jgi:phenylacetate-CoA ligase
LAAAITSEKPVHLSSYVFTIPLVPQMRFMLLPATLAIADMVKQLNARQPTHLIGFTTEIHRLAREASRGTLNINPQRISVNSEPLFPEMLEDIKQAWNVPVTNMWGSSDAGPHAQNCDYSNHLHLNEDLLIIEPVDEQYRSVLAGQESAKILVTNLFHRTMPLFRYEIEDRVTVLEERCPCGSSMSLVQSVKGRMDDDFIYSNGSTVISLVFENLIFPEAAIDEYQIFQTEQGAEVWLITNKEFDCATMQKSLVKIYEQLGFKHPLIEVKVVSQLKRHPDTSKLKRFVRIGSSSPY